MMSLKPQNPNPIPQQTAEVTHATFPKGNMYMQIRDELGSIYKDEQFVELFATRGQPGLNPWRLTWVTP
jgi:transposase